MENSGGLSSVSSTGGAHSAGSFATGGAPSGGITAGGAPSGGITAGGAPSGGMGATGGSMRRELCGVAVLDRCSNGIIHAEYGNLCLALTVTCETGCSSQPATVQLPAVIDAQSATSSIQAALCEQGNGGAPGAGGTSSTGSTGPTSNGGTATTGGTGASTSDGGSTSERGGTGGNVSAGATAAGGSSPTYRGNPRHGRHPGSAAAVDQDHCRSPARMRIEQQWCLLLGHEHFGTTGRRQHRR